MGARRERGRERGGGTGEKGEGEDRQQHRDDFAR